MQRGRVGRRVLVVLKGTCVAKLVESVISSRNARITREGSCERRRKGLGWIQDEFPIRSVEGGTLQGVGWHPPP